jgi:glycosyltransferase involved in cell wall biosynthesis
MQGGAEILAADVAAALERLGHEVWILTSSFGLPAAQQDGRIWRSLYNAPPAHFDRHSPLWQQLRLPYNYYRRYHSSRNAVELRRAVKTIHPDVVYVWELAGVGVTSLLRTLAELQIPVVFHLNSYWLIYASSPDTAQSRLHTRWLKQWLIGSVPEMKQRSFIAISNTVKQQYIQAGFQPERIKVIYNGIDPRFLTLPRTEDVSGVKVRSQLLFVGRLRVEKGLLVLLKALDILNNEQEGGVQGKVHLNVFGTGDELYTREMESFLREKGLTEIVTFHGTVPQDELIGHYDRADMLLVPSLWQEPFGLVVAEAMARGLPVIASHLGGPAEILVDKVNGLLVEPNDEQALVSAMREMLDHPEKRQQLGKAARVTVQQRFTIEENARHVERHLLKVTELSEDGFLVPGVSAYRSS